MSCKRLCMHCLLLGGFFVFNTNAYAQAPIQKEVNQQVQTWVSINSTMRLSNKWGLLGDVHIRRNNFLKDPSFYFARIGANYWVNEKFTVAAGYAHLWLAPTHEGWETFSNENRIYQQALLSTKAERTGLLFRVRNEQRWKEVIVNDKPNGELLFSNRVRFLMSFNFPLSRKSDKWALVVSDEILFNFGNDIVYNTFDQNRIFFGLRNKINKTWSYDIGYMNVYQQKPSGYQYDLNHTFRWFFYYTPNFRKNNHPPKQVIDNGQE